MNEVINKESLINVRDLATILNVSVRTVQQAVVDLASTCKLDIVVKNAIPTMLNELQCTAIKQHIQGKKTISHSIKIDYENEQPTVLARDLHAFLEVKTEYKDWFPRMVEYGFIEGKDFSSFLSESTGGRPQQNHRLSINMAKELCMIQRTDKGKEARQYFIQVEEQYNNPQMLMARALRIADSTIKELSNTVAIMKPKAEYFDALVDRNLLTNFRDTAKELNISQNDFVQFLIKNKYVYRDNKGVLKPYSAFMDLFQIKEWQQNEKAGIQTLITPRGRATFKLLLQREV